MLNIIYKPVIDPFSGVGFFGDELSLGMSFFGVDFFGVELAGVELSGDDFFGGEVSCYHD